MKTVDLRWPEHRNALRRAVPKIIEIGGNQLTERELEVLKLFGSGLGFTQIGAELGNALTGEPLTRARIGQILHLAVEKALAGRMALQMRKNKLKEMDAWARVESTVILNS